MGLDEFRTENSGTDKNNEESDAISSGGNTRKVYSYNEQRILNEIQRYEEEHNTIDKESFHRDSDYPSATTVRKYFDTWNNALEEATGEINHQSRESVDEWKVYLDILIAADEYGIDFTASQINRDSNLISHPQIKKITQKTFNEAKRHLSLPVNKNRDVSEEDIIEELNKLDCDLTGENIDNKCSFSSYMVRKYGDGYMPKALVNLGFEPSEKQKVLSNTQKLISSNPSPDLEKYGEYDKGADGYVYVLKLIDTDNNEWYYVGQISENSSLKFRLENHFRCDGDFSTNIDLEFENIELNNIYNLYKKKDSSKFKKKVNEKERETSYSIAIKYNTKNVLGGH